MKILVTDGNNRAALAITRSLGRAGYEVLVGAQTSRSLAGASKFCRRCFRYADPDRNPQAFIAAISEVAECEKPEVILPASEITTILITEAAENLRRFSCIPFPSASDVKFAANKARVVQLAEINGIPIPKTFILNHPHDLGQAIDFSAHIGFPVVIKPACSRFRSHNGFLTGKTNYAYNSRQLRNILKGFPTTAHPILVQERVVGPGVGIFVLAQQGRLLSIFSHRRMREKPPSGGVSVLRRSYPIDPRLHEQALKLIEALNWHGVGMVEYKRDNASGQYKLMEINGRFWGSLQLAIDAGVDFPLKLVKIALGETVRPDFTFRLGVQTRWFWGDVDAFLTRTLRPDTKLNLPPGYPKRWDCFKRFIRFRGNNLHYEVLQGYDIGPWIIESLRWFHLIRD